MRFGSAAVLAPIVAVVLLSFGCPDDRLVDVPGGIDAQLCSTTTGRVAAGATVTATFTQPATGKVVHASAVADDNGFVHFDDLPATAVTLDVRVADDFENTFADVAVEPGRNTEVVDPACRDRPGDPGTGSVEGDICNRHTGAVERDAQVFVVLGDDTHVSTHTDANGHFLLEGVPVGPQVVFVQSPSYQLEKRVDVKLDQTVPFDDAPVTCTPPDPLTTGTVIGNICGTDAPGDPGGPLADVHVSLVDPVDGLTYDDFTGPDGSFAIAGIPVSSSGITVDVRAQKGPFFKDWPGVNVLPFAQQGAVDLTVTEGCVPLAPDLDVKMLVVKGFYDHIESALERMQFTPELIEGNPDDFHDWTRDAFGTRDALESHQIVFVNCGVAQDVWAFGLSPTVKDNLKHYVQNGGTLYVSDWAYPIVEQVWPDKINFIGDDLIPDVADVGVGETTYHASVNDPGLVDYASSNTIDVDINFGNFAVMSEVAGDVSTFLSADEQLWLGGNSPVQILHNAPMTVRFNDGLGRVIFTSFHQEQDSSHVCVDDSGCSAGLQCDSVDRICVAPVDGPEDLVLRYLVFHL